MSKVLPWQQIWVGRLSSMVLYGNETLCSLSKGTRTVPLFLHSGGEQPVVLPRRQPSKTRHHFLIIFEAFSVGTKTVQYHQTPVAFNLFLHGGPFAFSGFSPNEESKQLRVMISTWTLLKGWYFQLLLNTFSLTFIKLCLQKEVLLLPLFCTRVCSQVLVNPFPSLFSLALLNT